MRIDQLFGTGKIAAAVSERANCAPRRSRGRSRVIKSTGRLVYFALLILSAGCSAAYHAHELHSEREREMTLGAVQKEIRRGLSQADVAEALGSPNIVTRDSAGHETEIIQNTWMQRVRQQSNFLGQLLRGIPRRAQCRRQQWIATVARRRRELK